MSAIPEPLDTVTASLAERQGCARLVWNSGAVALRNIGTERPRTIYVRDQVYGHCYYPFRLEGDNTYQQATCPGLLMATRADSPRTIVPEVTPVVVSPYGKGYVAQAAEAALTAPEPVALDSASVWPGSDGNHVERLKQERLQLKARSESFADWQKRTAGLLEECGD